jgi:unspecific monooxygenase
MPHAYKPFGTGERSCIGRQFAIHESVLALARLVHRYDLSGDPDYELRITERLTVMPEEFELVLTPRRPASTGGVTSTADVPDAEPETCPYPHHTSPSGAS